MIASQPPPPDRASSLCSLGCPGTQYVEYFCLQLRDAPASASHVGIKEKSCLKKPKKKKKKKNRTVGETQLSPVLSLSVTGNRNQHSGEDITLSEGLKEDSTSSAI